MQKTSVSKKNKSFEEFTQDSSSTLASANELVSSSTLVARNISVGGRRTSMRLEPTMWDALEEIALREGCTLHDLCERIDERRSESALTAAVRVFVLSYFRVAATESGHANAGHGKLGGKTLKKRGRPKLSQPTHRTRIPASSRKDRRRQPIKAFA